jgi:kinesin family protein C1
MASKQPAAALKRDRPAPLGCSTSLNSGHGMSKAIPPKSPRANTAPLLARSTSAAPPPRNRTRTEIPSSVPEAVAPAPPPPPTAAEKTHTRLLLEREWLENALANAQSYIMSLEAQCEAAVNSSEARVGEHRRMLAHKVRKSEAEVRDLRAAQEDLKRADHQNLQRNAELQEDEVVLRADTQRIRDHSIPMAHSSNDKLSEALTLKRKTVADRHEEVAMLCTTVRNAQSVTFGLSSEAATVVQTMEDNRQRRAVVKDETMRQEVDRRALFNEYEELKGTIRVYCRVKGSTSAAGGETDVGAAKYVYPQSGEIERQAIEVTQSRSNATSTGTRDAVSAYQYDRVFTPTASQEEVFAEVGTLVDSAVDGYKTCAFAYGQTGSGKTFTMEGSRSNPGIIPRSIEKVFERIAGLRDQQWEYVVSCTFVEIYNDCIRNLLETSEQYHREFADGHHSSVKLKNKHDIVHIGKTDTVISGVKDVPVKSPSDILKLLDTASRNRSVARTNMNERSSRSHCVFTMRICGSNRLLKQKSEGILCLIDLAGSERVNDSGAEGKELKEAIAINRSLMHLGDCIGSLGSNTVVSWRNSRLTYLLQNFLSGEGAKMLMLVMISDREEHVSETNNSLRFASKVNATQIGTAKKRLNPAT